MVASAERSSSEWQFSKTILVQEEAEYRSIFLDEEVYAKAQDSLIDVRIIDDQQQFVPFYRDAGLSEEWGQETIYSSVSVAHAVIDQASVIDFRVNPIMDHLDIEGNVLTIAIPEQPFLKYIEVHGSYDGKQWEALKKDYLYRTDQLYKDTIVLDQVNKFVYYRLKILDNVEGLKFPEMELLHDQEQFNWTEYSKAIVPKFTIDHDNQQTIISIVNDDKLKVKKIVFQAEGNFLRSYSLDGPNGTPIQVSGDRELFNLAFEAVQLTNTEIELKRAEALSQFTIKINNGDNKPLAIKNLTVEYNVDKLIFEDNGSSSYQLIYGNPNAKKPTYDIEQFKHLIDEKLIQLNELAQELNNPDAAKSEDQKSGFPIKYIFNGVIIGVSILLVIVLARKMGNPNK